MSAKTDPKRGQSSGLVIALVASFLVLLSPSQPALALPADLESGNYANDGSCDLGITGSADPSVSAFPISTPGQLWELADCSITIPGNYYQLTQDIDATSISWSESIGFSSSSTFPFVGNLDGNNFKIEFTISSSRTDNNGVGLFAQIEDSTIADLALSGSVVSETSRVGSLTGRGTNLSMSSISGTTVVQGTTDIGGLIGKQFGTAYLEDISFSASVTSNDLNEVGGLIGGFDGTYFEIEGLSLRAAIPQPLVSLSAASVAYVGGILGYIETTTLSLNSISAHITANGAISFGGLIGITVTDTLEISNAIITASLSISPFLTGTTSAGAAVGGLLGDSYVATSTSISNVEVFATIAGRAESVGGLIGWNDGTTLEIQKAYVDADIYGVGWVGGIVGYQSGEATLSEVIVVGTIEGSGEPSFGSTTSAGGAIGYGTGSDVQIRILDSLVTANLSVSGGLVGGIVGDTGISTTSVTISNTLFAGSIDAPISTDFGALYGGDGGVGFTFASSSHWIGDANLLLSNSPAALAANFTSVETSFLTLSQQKDPNSFVGWNFSTVWGFDCSFTNPYPQLRWQFTSATSSTTCVSGPSGAPAQLSQAVPGPVILSYTPSVVDTAGSQNVTFTGVRLLRVTSVSISGLVAPILSQSDTSLLVDIPALVAGSYSVDFTYDQGSVVRLNFLMVEGTSPQAALGKVNVGSFNGKLVVYAANLEGSRISWKVGGRWGRAVASTDFARFDRPTPRRGVQVTVQIFVDGELKLTKVVRTR